MNLRYEIVTLPRGEQAINAYDDETGLMLSIPMNEENSDYQAYLKWLEEEGK